MAIWLALVTCGAAQPPAPAVQAAATGADQEVGPVNLSKSLMFSRNRELEQTLREAENAFRAADWRAVGDCVLTLMDAGPQVLVESEGVYRSATEEADRLLSRMPESGRAAYRRRVDATAQEQLQAALRQADAAALLKVARQFRFTAAGRQALQAFARFQRDQGCSELVALASAASQVPIPRDVAFSGPEELAANTSGGRSVPPEFLSRQFPSAIPSWSLEREPQPGAVDVLQRTFHDLRQSGLSPYPSLSLIAASNVIVVCTPTERLGLDPDQGREIWRRPLSEPAANWLREPGSLADANRYRLFAMEAARQVFGNSAHSRMTSHGEHVYLVESIPPGELPSRVDSNVTNADQQKTDPPPASRIVCLHARTGEVRWMQPGPTAANVFIAGPPAILGDMLYVLGESLTANAVVLLKLDARTGKQLDEMQLAQPLVPISKDQRRQGQACQIQFDGRRLLCPTAAGALIAVDPLWNEIVWAFRYPRSDAVPFHSDTERQGVYQAGFQWWDSWQETHLLEVQDRLIFASPDSNLLHVLHRSSGELLWSVPRSRALTIAAASQEQGIVLLEKTAARALDLETGREKWTASIPQPAGRGVSAGHDYLFPVQEQGVARLNLDNGHCELSFPALGTFAQSDGVLNGRIRPRNLVIGNGGLFELSVGEVRKLQSPDGIPAMAQSSTPFSEILRTIERGEWKLAAAQLQKQLHTAPDQIPSPAREILLTLLTSAYRSVASPAEGEELSARISPLVASARERAIWRQLQAQEKIRLQDWPASVGLWLGAPREELDVLLPSPGEDARCRLDRWFQAEMLAVEARLSEAERQQLTRFIDAALPDPRSLPREERSRLERCLGGTPWGQHWILAAPADPHDLPSLIGWQMKLLGCATSDDPLLAAGGAFRLLELYDQRRNAVDAQRWLARLEECAPDLHLPDGRQVQDLLNSDAARIHHAARMDPARRAWPDGPPQVQQRTSWSTEVYLFPFPIAAAAGSLFSRLAVEMEYPAHRAIRFNGSRWNRPWLCGLPVTSRNLRHEVDLDHGWGLEQLLVLQTGSEVYGLTPFEWNQDRGGVLVWPQEQRPIDTLGDRDNLMLSFLREFLPERPGFNRPPLNRLDEFQHQATAVGPVCAGYFCLQQFGMLVAFETATGRELWRRYDLPKRAQCYGDDQFLAVVSPEFSTISLINPIDGRLLGLVPRTFQLESIISADGTEVVLARGDQIRFRFEGAPGAAAVAGRSSEADQPVELERINMISGESRWIRSWPAGSLPFEMDDRWLGVLSPGGQVEFLDLQTGIAAAQHLLDVPEKITRIACSAAEHDLIVVFSSMVEDSDLLSGAQLRGGYRRPFVNGPAYCFRRENGQQLWRTELGETVFPVDQPADLPVFVTVEGRIPRPADEENASPVADSHTAGSRIRCFDRRTGQLLSEIRSASARAPDYSLVGDRESLRIRLHTIKTRMEIDFSGLVDEPARTPVGK